MRAEVSGDCPQGVALGLRAGAGDGEGARRGISARDRLANTAGASEHDGNLSFDRKLFEWVHQVLMIQYKIRFPERTLPYEICYLPPQWRQRAWRVDR